MSKNIEKTPSNKKVIKVEEVDIMAWREEIMNNEAKAGKKVKIEKV